MLGGRVKTLHPVIHGGILADRSKPDHLDALDKLGIGLIDLVVCNLYPFTSDPSIELIDVGGPTMVRAAAKNHDHVAVVVDPADYPRVLEELRTDGSISLDTRRRLARQAFAHTAGYDAAIVAWLDEREQAARAAGRRRRDRPRGGGPPARHHPPDPRAGRLPPLRREPAPARCPLPGGRPGVLVGRRGPARGQGALVPQRVRRRRRLAPRPRARLGPGRAGRGHHQARQPVRGGPRRRPGPGLRAGPRVRPAVGLRRDRGHRRPGDGGRGRGHRRRPPGRRDHRPLLRRRGAGPAVLQAQGHPAAVGPGPRGAGPPVPLPRGERPGPGRRPVPGRPRPPGRWPRSAGRPRPSGRTCAWPGRSVPAPPPTPSPS